MNCAPRKSNCAHQKSNCTEGTIICTREQLFVHLGQIAFSDFPSVGLGWIMNQYMNSTYFFAIWQPVVAGDRARAYNDPRNSIESLDTIVPTIVPRIVTIVPPGTITKIAFIAFTPNALGQNPIWCMDSTLFYTSCQWVMVEA